MKEPEFKEVCRVEKEFCHQLGHAYEERFLAAMWKELDRDDKWEYYNDLLAQVDPKPIDPEFLG